MTTHAAQPMHVAIAGGGLAGLEALMALRDHAEARVRITLKRASRPTVDERGRERRLGGSEHPARCRG